MKKYKVTLTAEERNSLQDLIAAGKAAAQKLAHARILLKADAAAGGPAWTDDRIAEAVEVSADHRRAGPPAVRRAGAGGRPGPQEARPAQPGARSWTARAEARLIALACSEPPDGPGARGRCGCWPTSWSSWRSWTRSPTRRCGRR